MAGAGVCRPGPAWSRRAGKLGSSSSLAPCPGRHPSFLPGTACHMTPAMGPSCHLPVPMDCSPSVDSPSPSPITLLAPSPMSLLLQREPNCPFFPISFYPSSSYKYICKMLFFSKNQGIRIPFKNHLLFPFLFPPLLKRSVFSKSTNEDPRVEVPFPAPLLSPFLGFFLFLFSFSRSIFKKLSL